MASMSSHAVLTVSWAAAISSRTAAVIEARSSDERPGVATGGEWAGAGVGLFAVGAGTPDAVWGSSGAVVARRAAAALASPSVIVLTIPALVGRPSFSEQLLPTDAGLPV